MTNTRLTKKAIEFLKDEDGLRCRNRLAFELNLSQYTIQRYINNNDEELTKVKFLSIIAEEMKTTPEKLLTDAA